MHPRWRTKFIYLDVCYYYMVRKIDVEDYGMFSPKYFIQAPEKSGGLGGSGLDDILDADRRDILDRMDKLQDYVSQRKQIMYDNLERIDQDSCDINNRIEHVKVLEPYNHTGMLDIPMRHFHPTGSSATKRASASSPTT